MRDHDDLVNRLRTELSEILATEADNRERKGQDALTSDDREVLAAGFLQRRMREEFAAATSRGDTPLTEAEERDVTDAVMVSVTSRLPALVELLKIEDATDIYANGHDDVRVVHVDGTTTHHGPIARSDTEMEVMLQAIARSGGGLATGDILERDSGVDRHEKEFNRRHPFLNLTLPDGSRLAAAAWVTGRPYLSIRRHPLRDFRQKDLVRAGMYGEDLASLFAAAVRARMSILVAGGQGKGKTTLMRALLHECDPDERICVLETEPELHLGVDPVQHNQVLSWIGRPDNMENEGGVTLADLALAVKRHSPQRIVIGEVLGGEILDMLEAASQGVRGAICTMHAHGAEKVWGRIVHYAQLGKPDVKPAFVLGLAADTLDLIVYLDVTPDGRRVVSEVSYVHHYDRANERPITDEWYVAGEDGAAIPKAPIASRVLDELVSYGYDPDLRPGPW